MLNICCVAVDLPNYMDGRARDAVEILYSMVRRNLAAGHQGRFTVFTDDPAAFADMAGVQTKLLPAGLEGWWNKLYLFSEDAFPKGERVLFFDLDTAITGQLDDIAGYTGKFAMLEDAYRPGRAQSAVMGWEAGTLNHIWSDWLAAGCPKTGQGDQVWIEHCTRGTDYHPECWQALFPGQLRSYKLDCREFVPRGTSVVYFHGLPRPHQCGGWVKDCWRVTDEAIFFALNVKEDQLRANVRSALGLDCRWIAKGEPGLQSAVIVAGGPSMKDNLWRIHGYQKSGAVVYATNNAAKFLLENGIVPDAHVMHDARVENLAFVPDLDIPKYYASQCHPEVLAAAGKNLICWHPHSQSVLEEVKSDPRGMICVSGGSTIGLNAVSLAYILGHRKFDLFGFDSCYSESDHHAYAQTLNDGDLVLDAIVDGKAFRCAPWMVQQAEQFLPLYEQLKTFGCEVHVHGEGIIPFIADNAANCVRPADERAKSILERLAGFKNPVGAEIGVFAGELSRRLLRRPDLNLLMVDSWRQHDPDSDYAKTDFHGKLPQSHQDEYRKIAQKAVEFAGARAQVRVMDSVDAAEQVPDGSLDFVFIDADHTYEGCRRDILAWLPKVRAGGIISGHDYANGEEWGVKRAVDEIFGSPETGLNFTWFASPGLTNSGDTDERLCAAH